MRHTLAIAFVSMSVACGAANETPTDTADGAGGSGSVSASSGSGGGAEACTQLGETRPCWTGPASRRFVGDCHDGTQECVESTDGEFVTSTWGPCTGEELDCGGSGSSSGDENGSSSGGEGGSPPSPRCTGICTGGQLGPSMPVVEEHVVSNSVITTGGGGSAYIEVVGDNNVITTAGGGTCVFDVYGSNNTITFSGGGSNVVNILDGTDNTVDFSPGGGCNSVYFQHGSLTSIIPSCGWGGNNVNGEPAEDVVYTLP